MPRSSGRSSGGRSAPASSRGTHSMASRPAPQTAPVPHQQHGNLPAQQQQAQPRQPGLFANMASTAAGVAVGSSVGHGISNMLFGGGGGSSAEPQAQEQAPPMSGYDQQQPGAWGSAPTQQQAIGASCEVQSKDFMRCLESTQNDMQSCSYYLEALKACQAAARPY